MIVRTKNVAARTKGDVAVCPSPSVVVERSMMPISPGLFVITIRYQVSQNDLIGLRCKQTRNFEDVQAFKSENISIIRR